MTIAAVFPLQPGGAAEDAAALLGARGRLDIVDRTAHPRWGIKGPGSADWFAANGLALPPVNHHAKIRGLTVLRLGRNDVTLLADPAGAGALAALRGEWQGAFRPKGYSSWREEGWAWLAISGEGLETALRRLSALDLRPGRFAADAIAQSRFAHVDAVFFRSGESVQLFFDITATAAVLRNIARSADQSAEIPKHRNQHK